MGDLQWDYGRELARLGNLTPIPPVIEALFKVSSPWGSKIKISARKAPVTNTTVL
jgi:hypothetical protein